MRLFGKILILFLLLAFPLRKAFASIDSNQTKTTIQPFLFEENRGQFHANVLFRCVIPDGYLFIEKDGLTYLFEDAKDLTKLAELIHEHRLLGPYQEVTLNQHVLKVRFNNFKPYSNQSVLGYQPVGYATNYFLGNDQSRWASGVQSFEKLRYHNVYPGIDLFFYTDETGGLKYDWIIREEGDFELLSWTYEGASSIITNDDHLIITTSVNTVIESPPILVSDLAVDITGIAPASMPRCNFVLDGNEVHFSMEAMPEKPYRIDPKLIFSTYSGAKGDNFGFTATYDSKGNLFAGGITNNIGGEYPVTSGAVQKTYGGGKGSEPANLRCDISISKYDSAGTKLLWATYLGGSSDEYPHSLVVDNQDNLFILGTTYSEDFPVSTGAYDESHNGKVDIIVVKLSSDGTVLMGSTFVGGEEDDGLNSHSQLRYNYADDFRGDIITDENGHVFVASSTDSKQFPLRFADNIDTVQANQDGCVFELNENLSVLEWSTLLGGSGRDALYSIKVNGDSMVYVGGGTSSNDLPTTSKVLNDKYLGAVDGFIAALDRKNHTIKKLTYWGTSSYDQVYFIDLDHKGALYITGQTTGNIKPTSGLYGDENKGQFIAKLDTSLNKVMWQTSFGVRDNQIDISPSAFLVDNCEHIYVSGWGSTVRPDLNPGSTNGLVTTGDALQSTTDGNDFYILVLNKNASSILYATFFGGDISDDHVDGGTSRFDKKGVVYQSVCASCPNGNDPGYQDFPITPNAAFKTNLSPRCSNASFKIDLQLKSAVNAYFIPNPIVGCSPLNVYFDNKSSIVKKFIWDFGDGFKDSTNLNPNHTYTEPGEYLVRLTVIDSNTCNISDQYTRVIRVIDFSKADFEFTVDPCTFKAKFNALSEPATYRWDLGDGNSSNKKKLEHQYQGSSTYDVWLYINEGTLCADSIRKFVNTAAGAQREFKIPNVFTPNNDGLNDEYCLEGFNQSCDSIHLWIYSRWGELVFETKSIDECWDGREPIKNVFYPGGTYFYVLDLNQKDSGEHQRLSGSITLIRD
ncbi:MAG: gliding motility-associated-like protein [Bacteroidia bacterium]